MTVTSGTDRGYWRLLLAVLTAFALIAAACGDDDDDAATSSNEPAPTEAPADDPEPADPEPEATEPDDPEPEPEPATPGAPDEVASMGPPTGEPIVIGHVNTEGPAGLNFPEIEEATRASIDYLNEHGGFGNRPVQLEVCIADGGPESSQACAQELAGKGAEMVLLGLDLFPDYATYDASGIPVAGILPLFPADFASSAIYLSGGNAALGAGNAYAVVEFFGASKVAIISADNAGANSSEAAVIAALEKAGIEYRSIKGAESETDAGAQGLVREALSDDPDVLISLYGDAGCIGMIRGRAALGSDVPVLAASTCTNAEVLDAVGDDALGWYFVPGGAAPDTPRTLALKAALAPMVGVDDPADVVVGDLGLGGLAPTVVFTVAVGANSLAASGGEVTGASIAEHMKANPTGDVALFPDGLPLECASNPAYPSVCDFSSFLGQYVGDGKIELVEGFERYSISAYFA